MIYVYLISQPPFVNEASGDVKEELLSLEQILDGLSQKLQYIRTIEFQPLFEAFLQRTVHELEVPIDMDKLIGVTFHITSVIENTIDHKVTAVFPKKDRFMITHAREIYVLKEIFVPIELAYNINLSDDSICYIYQMLKEI